MVQKPRMVAEEEKTNEVRQLRDLQETRGELTPTSALMPGLVYGPCFLGDVGTR